MRTISPEQADRAIWIDFEGTTTDPPSMLGVLWTPTEGSRPQLTQYVFDRGLDLASHSSAVDPTGAHQIVSADLETTLRDLVEFSEATKRHLVSWSLYDYNVIIGEIGRIAVRFRNAKAGAVRWRARRTQIDSRLPEVEFPAEELQRYLKLVGYNVPEDLQGDAAAHIRYVRERSAGKDSWNDVSDGGKEAWRRLIGHNLHDLYGMRRVTRLAVGLESLDGSPEERAVA